jgi:hypothetical protein
VLCGGLLAYVVLSVCKTDACLKNGRFATHIPCFYHSLFFLSLSSTRNCPLSPPLILLFLLFLHLCLFFSVLPARFHHADSVMLLEEFMRTEVCTA